MLLPKKGEKFYWDTEKLFLEIKRNLMSVAQNYTIF